MIQILRFEDTELNRNDKVVNSILKALGRSHGECPCDNPGKTTVDRLCPCLKYRETHECCCNLYCRI